MLQIVFHERVVLQISLNGVKLHHRIGDRRSGCKYRTTTARNLVKVAALHKKVAGFLRFGLCDTADIPHFGIKEQVFEVVGFVNINLVYAQLLKGNNIVFLFAFDESFQPCFKIFLCFLKLLYRKSIATLRFKLCNTVGDFLNLISYHSLLPFLRKRNFFKLRMTDYYCVVISCGNFSAKPLAVFSFKVFLCCYKDICRRI